MVNHARSALSGGIFVFLAVTLWMGSSKGAVPGAPSAIPAEERPARTEYQQWLLRYGRKDFTGLAVQGGSTQFRLIITLVEGEDRKRTQGEHLFFGSGISTSGHELSTNGYVQYFSHSDSGSKGGGGGSPLPAAELKRLDELLANLPDDGLRLPPAGRRMILQALVSDQAVARVYDRANAPKVVWEILRVSRCLIPSWVPEFPPQSEIDACSHEHGGFLCLSPDGQQILFASANGPLQCWEPTTHELLAEIRQQGIIWDGIFFSPDGLLAAIEGSGDCTVVNAKTWQTIKKFKEPLIDRVKHGLAFPQFTPDGRHLLLQCSKPSLEIFDTTTWQRVERLPEVPEDALQYMPAPKSQRALVRLKVGAVMLWDVAKRRKVATLDENAYLSQISFAPDESLVAVATAQESVYASYWGGPRIRILEAGNGTLVHELKPFEQAVRDRVEGLAWSPDGQYLLAVTNPSGFGSSRSISVFNVKTGHHRGDFTGCPTDVIGMALLPDGSQIVAGCHDGKIRFWDFEKALKEIKAFEASLPPLENRIMR